MQRVKLALIITYDGLTFEGWQDNLANSSIEGSLKKAFFELYGESIRLDAASRTDKGVHALMQVVVAFVENDKIPLSKLHHALNAKLPPTIRVKKVITVPEDFHPSLSAKKKTYQYRINLNSIALPFDLNQAWHLAKNLDIDLMQKAAVYFKGQKDFSSFTNRIEKPHLDTVCLVENIDITLKDNNFLFLEITADRFLYKMCRIIVGTLVQIGLKQIALHDLLELFQKKNRTLAGMTAPSSGLFLKSIDYPDFLMINHSL
jgi:tRNA pseudouridine38-40 synthase